MSAVRAAAPGRWAQRRWAWLVAGACLWAWASAALAQQGLPASQRAIQSYCNDRVQRKEEPEVAACVAREAARLRESTVACAKQGQIQDVRTADLAAFMERCIASADFTQFQQQQAERSAAEGRRLGREYSTPLEALRFWTNFDGAVDMRIYKVLLAQWIGEFQADLPEGPGELLAEVQYRKGVLVEKPFIGVVHLQGTMKRGRFVGAVKALKHVAWADSKDRAESNDFIEGRSAGLVADPSDACSTSGLAQDGSTRARFFGACRNGTPYQGLVVYEYRGIAFDLACMSRGAARARNELDAFEPCDSFWRHLPQACQVGDYRGQCENGRPHGVGIVKTTKTEQAITRGAGAGMPNLFSPGMRSYYLRRGMFLEGEQAGFGYFGLMEGCGPAGCGGDRSEQLGWFERGSLRYSCTTPQACAAQLSGRDYVRWLRGISGVSASAAPAAMDTSAAAINAFHASGETTHLRRAGELARSSEERAALEYELMRVTGFDKAFSTSVEVNAGGSRSVSFSESEKFLGFLRSTDSKVPMQVSWRIRSDPEALRLRHGQYVVKAVIGLRVRMKRMSCFLGSCGESTFTDVFERRIESKVQPAKPEASGEFDLRQTASSASVLLGTSSFSEFVNAEPYVRIESVRPSP